MNTNLNLSSFQRRQKKSTDVKENSTSIRRDCIIVNKHFVSALPAECKQLCTAAAHCRLCFVSQQDLRQPLKPQSRQHQNTTLLPNSRYSTRSQKIIELPSNKVDTSTCCGTGCSRQGSRCPAGLATSSCGQLVHHTSKLAARPLVTNSPKRTRVGGAESWRRAIDFLQSPMCKQSVCRRRKALDVVASSRILYNLASHI